MVKVFRQLAVLWLVAGALTACQSVDTSRVKNVKETPKTESNALIYCAGTVNCEFERWNQIEIVNEKNQRLSKKAVENGIVRLQTQSLKDANALYLSVPEGTHEVVIRFYPISRDKAETLHVIQKFNSKYRYTFKMYRNRNKNKGTLLNVSAPNPLCVDLLKEQKTIRRFCKPYNVLNGLGEFVEQKI
jgi:hypothetical protein